MENMNWKMGADSQAENTPNVQKHFSPKCPKDRDFWKKKLFLGVCSPCTYFNAYMEVEKKMAEK